MDVLITRDFLKVNAPSVRYVQVLDLYYPVDPEHPSTKVTLLDERLEVTLFKASPGVWDSLQIFGLTKDELKARREESLRVYYAREEEKHKAAEQTKYA